MLKKEFFEKVFFDLGPEAEKQSWWWRFSCRVVMLLDALLIRRTRDKPWCCTLLCPGKAEWGITDISIGSDPYNGTHACTGHVGSSLGNSGLYEVEQLV